jgi:putative ABC transport system substrate-binding protein
MTRRDFLTLGGALAGAAALDGAWPRPAVAQTAKIYRLGTLTPTLPMDEKSPFGTILLKQLAQQGYMLGQNLSLEARGAGGDVRKLGGLVHELKANQIDVVIAIGFPTALACKVDNLPTVVAFGGGDPVATHMIDSLAHPGGSITGISDNATALSTKRLALIKQAVPDLHRVAMLWNRDDLGMSMRYESSATAAKTIGVTVQPLGVREPDDFNDALEAMDRDPPQAILMVADSLTVLNRKRVYDYAAAHHIPAMYEYTFLARDGGLMSYGADLTESFQRAGDLAARIFKGVKPGDLPFEEPTRYPLVVNLKTAKAAGINLPPEFVALADEVIE